MTTITVSCYRSFLQIWVGNLSPPGNSSSLKQNGTIDLRKTSTYQQPSLKITALGNKYISRDKVCLIPGMNSNIY